MTEPIASGAAEDDPLGRATSYLDAGRPAEAAAVLVRHVANNPQDVPALLLLSGAQRELGKFADSLATAKQAITLAPDDEHAWATLALAQTEGGLLPSALKSIARALELAPNDWRYHVLRAGILRMTDRPDQLPGAESAARTAIRLAPDQPAGHIELGYALLGQKKRADAKTAFTEALRLDPTNTEARAGLAGVKASRGNFLAASSTFAQTLRENPEDELAQRNLVFTVVEAARVTGLVAVVAMVVALRLGRAGSRTSFSSVDWTSTIPAGIVLIALIIYAVMVTRLVRSGTAQLRTLARHSRPMVIWLVVCPLGLIAMAVLFLLRPPIETITWVALPILVITVAPGLIGVDRAKRLLAAWDDRIFRPGDDGLDEQSQRERQVSAAQHTIAVLTKRRRYLRGAMVIVLLIFGGLELLARSSGAGYVQKSPWLMLGIGGVWIVILVIPAIVVEIRLHRLNRLSQR